MALILTTNHGTIQFNLPFTLTNSKDFGNAVKELISVQADGQELEYIKQAFTNLPMRVGSPQTPGGLVVTWYGELAKFIVSNL
ncbi:hypothetical protein Q5H92_14585 [Hymenobacter sp. M29]|uniref:Uncharacterized protein n=1 Tax=Hymenobacter mellowenesis TaxID=3063995 RepID=A0ABT9ADZ4_9BACT|nr:hypothetical protein [Hymenobacter sp. M29]MDO7847594.1 hypothetical protein [Hymenobacter sp. M29]